MKPRVLVVGAGPVGLTMAAELARYGVSLRIVDKAAQRTDKSKALVVWSRTLELLDAMGCGPAFVAAGNKVSSAAITADGKPIAHIGLGDVASPHPYALMLPQSETERLLEEHLATLGVTVEREVELVGLAARDDGVATTLRRSDQSEERLETEWLIACDGAHSTVRHALGIDFTGDTLPSEWILADIHLEGMRTPPSELELMWHAEGVLVFFPISPSRYRVVADVGLAPSGGQRPEPTLEEVQTILDRRGPGGIRASDPIWLSSFGINERKIAEYRKGRVFLAGDAAHIHSPAGGQGMNTGMQDACNLAWKLALICHGRCAPDPLLGSYSTERSVVGEKVLADAGRLTALAVIKNPVVQTVRNIAAGLMFGLSPVRRAVADTLTEVSIGYPHSPLNAARAHGVGAPGPGDRAPVRAGETPVGTGPRPRFVLFAQAWEAAGQLAARYPEIIDPEIRPPFGPDGLWLVRPDGYTALVAKEGAWSEVAAYLDGLGAIGVPTGMDAHR